MESITPIKSIIVHWIDYLNQSSMAHATFTVNGITLFVCQQGNELIFHYGHKHHYADVSSLNNAYLNQIMATLMSRGDFPDAN